MASLSRPSTGKSLPWLFALAGSVKGWLAASVGFGLAGGLLLVAQAAAVSTLVNGAFMEGVPRRRLLPWFFLMAGIIVVRAVCTWAREITGFRAGAAIRSALRSRLMAHLAALGPAHGAAPSTGALATSVLERVESLHNFFAYYIPQMALAVMIPLAIAAFVFPVSWAAGGLLLITAPLIPLFMVLVGMGAEAVSQRHFTALSRMSGHFLDTLRGISTLKLFDRSRAEAAVIESVSAEFRRRTMKVLKIAFLSAAVLEFFSAMAIALVAVYLGLSYLGYIHFGAWGSPLTFAGGFFILVMAPDFYLPLRELGTHYHARAEAMGAADDLLRILSLSPFPKEAECPAVRIPDVPKIIRCSDLVVEDHNGRRPALDGIRLELRRGEHLAVVGESGAGKTTLLQVLMGFKPPTRGNLQIDGKEMSRLDKDSWLSHIGWLGQQPFLFYGTIRENIALGTPDADTAAVENAARLARVTEFADRLPHGLDTTVGENHAGLSTGQAQRVALARAFLKNAPILFLDEPTAGLDAASEKMILEALAAFGREKTVVTCTHRLEHLADAHRVIVLEKGRIAEEGTFDALMATDGLLRQLIHGNETTGRADA